MKKYYESEYYPQPTMVEIKSRAAISKSNASHKGKDYNPITIKGKEITSSWWGNAWCANLERYSDYISRLERGKRYVRAGAVVDLDIKKGKVLARVQGTRRIPYKVEIKISPLSEERCQDIIQRCGARISTVESLIKGDFPEELKELFLEENGLFPESKEISFSCSCPDWAIMCKHVAAAVAIPNIKMAGPSPLFSGML